MDEYVVNDYHGANDQPVKHYKPDAKATDALIGRLFMETDNFEMGLTELAAKLRKGGVAKNQGIAGFLLRCRDRLKSCEEELRRLQDVVDAVDAEIIEGVLSGM